MTFNVFGQMRIGLRVQGANQQYDFPINPSLLDQIIIIQNNLMKVPVVQLTLHDNVGLQENQAIFGDGNRFSIDIGWDQSDEPYRSHPFRIYSLPHQLNSDHGIQIQILGYLDIPKYFRQRVERPWFPAGRYWHGNSSEVIEAIATQNELTFEGDVTDDSQIWLPDGRSFADYARFVTNHGWAGLESCMELAITQIPNDVSQQDTNEIPWMLRYFDLTQRMQQPATAVLFTTVPQDYSNDPPGFTILDLDVKNHSGFFNHWLNYGNRIGQEQLTGEYTESERTEVRLSMASPEINRDLYQEYGVIRREVAPVDCGNTHSNFVTAYHQNRRIKASYSTTVEVVVLEHTPIRLFDKVELRSLVQQSEQLSETYRGDYLVTAKSIAIAGGAYREKFELVGQGSNNDIEDFRL